MSKTADTLLRQAADLYEAKNEEYGDNFRKVGPAMAQLFPNGLKVETADDWNRLHIFLLTMVKLTRYSSNWHKGGHRDSVKDLTVYSAMLEMIDEEISGDDEIPF